MELIRQITFSGILEDGDNFRDLATDGLIINTRHKSE